MTTHTPKPNPPLLAVLAAALLAGLWACSSKSVTVTPEIAASDEQLFKLGESVIKRDPDKARIYLRQVIDSFPKSYYAQRAKLAIANSYFDQGDEANLILATAEYRDFIRSYPYSPSASFAQYRIALTFYNQALKPGRDQSKTHEALSEFKKVSTEYPLSDEAKLAQVKARACEQRLADHYFGIAQLYNRYKAFRAAISRLTEILTEYPNYTKMDQVYYFLADSYYRGKKPDESVPYFTKLVSDYPRSKYTDEAAEALAEIAAAKKAKPTK